MWFTFFVGHLGLAFAHLPHDEVIALAAPAALDASGPWLLLGGDDGHQLLSRSDDGGHRWHMIGGALMEDVLSSVALLDDGTWLALGEQGLWWSDDEGVSWTLRVLERPMSVLAGGPEVVLGGGRGALHGRPDGLLLPLPMASLATVTMTGDGGVALDRGGRTWLQGDNGWVDQGVQVAGASRVTRAAGTVFIGTTAGAVVRVDAGAVTACGALPADAGAEHPDVVGMAVEGATDDDPAGVLVVATGDGGPYISRDGCSSWEDAHGPLQPLYTGAGSCDAVEDSTTALYLSGARWVQAGWAGLAVVDDGDVYQPQLIPPDYTRGIAFSSEFGDDHTILVGGYAAGVLRSHDAGATWLGAGPGLGDDNVQRVGVPENSERPEEVLAVSGHKGWISEDQGETWAPLSPPLASVTELFGAAVTGTLWAFGRSDQGPLVMFSDDNGETWAFHDAMNAALAGSFPSRIAHLQTPEGEALVLGGGAPSRVLYSFDEGRTWATRYATDLSSGASGPVVWPKDEPRRALFLDDAGVHISDDAVTWRDWGAFGAPASVIEGAGDYIFVSTRGGELWRSTDGGETFADLGVRTVAPVHVLRGAPPFDDTRLLLVGTHDGVFQLVDPTGPAPTLVRWAYQRVDDASAYFACVGCGDSVRDDSAGIGELRELGAAGIGSAILRGPTLEVYGTSTGDAQVELWIDGAYVSTIGATKQADPGVLTRVDGLVDDWHDVELRGVRAGVAIDALASFDAPPDTLGHARCGVAGDGGPAGLGLALVVVLRRRGVWSRSTPPPRR